jgi:hypothetical protein
MDSSNRQRRHLAPLTDVRAYRLRYGLSLFEVAHESGLTTFRASIIERDPARARPGEIDAHHTAVDRLSAKREAA